MLNHFHRSHSLNYLRKALYRLNENYYNNEVDSTFIKIYSKILDDAKEIQLLELKFNNESKIENK